MMHERPFGLREKELDPGKQKVDIVLFSPPVWSPVMPFLAIPTLMGYLRAKGIKAIQFDLSIDFFIDHLLTPLNLEKAMETIRRRGYGEGLPQNLQRLSEDLLRSGEKYKDIPQRVEDAKGVLRDKEYFFDIKRMLEAQSYLYRALEILSLSQYPIIFTFNTFSHREVRDFPSLFQFITKGENLFSSFYQTYVFELLKRYSPKLIGISISTSHQMIPGLTLATMLKNHFQDVTIVIGGRQVDRLLDTFVTFTEYSKKFCDILVYGDGELALEGLWECLKGTTNQSKIPNIVWFQEDTVVRSDKFQYIPITQKPSPCFFGIPFHKYLSPYPLIPVRFSEGCYWGKCSFCSRYDNRRFQTLSVDRAVKLLKSLSEELNTQFFMINDDCLTPKYLEALARGILEEGMEINLSLWAKPVSGFTRERLELLSKAGVRLIRWGIETGNERILKLMNKGTNLEDTVRVLERSSTAGIWNHGMFIMGFPTETEDEARETLNFLKRNADKIHSAIFFKFSLLKHSHIYNNKELYSINEIKSPESIFSSEYPFICSEGMDIKTLIRVFNWAQNFRIQSIYTNPVWFYTRIREYLFLYLSKYSIKQLRSWKVIPEDLKVYDAQRELVYRFVMGNEIDRELLERLKALISESGEVGRSWLEENLTNAIWVAYVEDRGSLVATMTHKRPKEKYLTYLKQKAGLDLSGYIERGYSYVMPAYRGMGIGDKMLKGLVEKTPGKPIYVTIRLDNHAAIRLTEKNGMKLAATFQNERTGHTIGIFLNG